MQVTETAARVYSVQLRVPKALPPRAVPAPLLPDVCGPVGDRAVTDQAGAWILTREWRCDVGLAGQELGIRYPFPDLALTTVIRVDLLSGDRFAHVYSPGDGTWRVPEGTAPPDPVAAARRAVLAGAAHTLGIWVHAAFFLLLPLLGGLAPAIRLVTVFTVGQLAAAAAFAGLGASLPAGPAEIGLAIAVVLVAREALRPPERRRSLDALVLVAGLVHGLGLPASLADDLGATPGFASLAVAALGVDAVHLLGVLVLCPLLGMAGRRLASDRPRAGLTYAAGGAGMAFALFLAFGGQASTTASSESLPGEGSATASARGPAASQRLAPSVQDAPIQSFVAVEPFEVRHEVMLRLSGLTEPLRLDAGAKLAIEDQPAVADSLIRLVLGGSRVEVDGTATGPLVRRSDFMTVDPTGALPRPSPVPEDVTEAVVGVVITYPTGGIPDRVTLTWDTFAAATTGLPVTVIDPENTASATLTSAEPSIVWQNELLENPVPSVDEVSVEPMRLPIPLLSLPLVLLAAVLTVAGLRGKQPTVTFSAARIVLAAAFVVGPVAQTAVAVPGSAGRVPSERQARRILSGLLPNVYRALEFREETAIYDRLAVSVTGATLTDVYLEQRRALELEERGGAQARVETVEVLGADDIERDEDGFSARAVWTVGGMVTHFGHRHFRQNRYDARIFVDPVEGAWKIRSMDILEQERLR